MATEWIKAQWEINFELTAEVFGVCGLIESVREEKCFYGQKKKGGGGSGQFHQQMLVIHRIVLGPWSPDMSKTQLLPDRR